MVLFLITATILLCCTLCHTKHTSADYHVTPGVNSDIESDKARTRSWRQTTRCRDSTERKANIIFTRGQQTVPSTNIVTANQCADWCLKNVRCIAVVSRGVQCEYTFDVNHGSGSGVIYGIISTYFKVILRCPKHYRCSNNPCRNGATCTSAGLGAVGITCICAGGWKSWFCEKRQTCQDNPCQNGATCRSAPSGGVTCSCLAAYAGFYCESLTTATTTTTTITTTTTTTIVPAVATTINTTTAATNTTPNIATEAPTASTRTTTEANTTVEQTEDQSSSTGLSKQTKALIAVATVGGVVMTAAAAATVVAGATSTTAGATATSTATKTGETV